MPSLVRIHTGVILRLSMIIFSLITLIVSSQPLTSELHFDVQAYSQQSIPLTTQSLFTVKTQVDEQVIDFEIEQQIDEEKDKCSDPEIKQPGQPGKIIKTTQVTYYEDKEYHRESLQTQRIDPIPQVIVKGNKKIFKTVNTPDGEIQYWCHLGTFRATAYDSRCPGCNETTAIGMKAGFGVVAVDPAVIPLRSKLYIQGYGFATAGDTGGNIKGKRIDLGFDQIDKSWGVRSLDVYML